MENENCNCEQSEFDSNEKHFKIALKALHLSTTDTEKFCALLIIAKFLKINKLTDEQISQIFKEIGWKFLYRLLLTDSNCGSIPDGCKGTIFQSISINILTCLFLTDLKLLDVPICIKLFTPINKILLKYFHNHHHSSNDNSETLAATAAAAETTTKFSATKVNAAATVTTNQTQFKAQQHSKSSEVVASTASNNGNDDEIVDKNRKGNHAIINDDLDDEDEGCKEDKHKEEMDLIYDILHCLDTFITCSYSNREIITILSQTGILQTLCETVIEQNRFHINNNNSSNRNSNNNNNDSNYEMKILLRYESTLERALSCQWSRFDLQSYNKCLLKIADEFKISMDKRKFELCNKIPIYLQHNAMFCSPSTNKDVKQWLLLITEGLYEILISRLSDNMRNPAFKLAAALTEAFNGLIWIQIFQDENNVEYSNESETSNAIENNEKSDLNIINLSNSNNNCDDGAQNISRKQQQQQQTSGSGHRLFLLLSRLICVEINIEFDNLSNNQIDYNLLASCFIVLEHIIAAIAMDESQQGLLKNLSCDDIYHLLTAIRETMACIINYLQIMYLQWDEICGDNEKCLSILGCIRLLCYWITEETEALRKEIRDILPFLLKIFEIEMRKGPESEIPVREIILPALQSLILNDSEENDFKETIVHSNIVSLIDEYKRKEKKKINETTTITNEQEKQKQTNINNNTNNIDDICDSLKNLLQSN